MVHLEGTTMEGMVQIYHLIATMEEVSIYHLLQCKWVQWEM